MKRSINPAAARTLGRLSLASSVLAMAFGTWVLVGWALHSHLMKCIFPGQVEVKANTAICSLLTGFALWVLRSEEAVPASGWKWVARAASIVASVVGLLSLLEFGFGWDVGIDQLLFMVEPQEVPKMVRAGLMSPITALGFLSLGPALLLVDAQTKLGRWLAQALPCGVVVASLFGVLNFVLDPNVTHAYISPMTAFVLFTFSFGLIFARVKWGLGALVASPSLGGVLIRRLFPAAILFPLVISLLQWKGKIAHLYSDWAGVSILTVGAIALLGLLTVWTGFVVEQSDRAHEGAEEVIARLASIVTASNDAIFGETLDGIVTSWNPGAEAIYGYAAQEMIGMSISLAVPSDRREELAAIMEKVRQGLPVTHFETIRVRKDRQTIDVSLTISPIRDESGQVVEVSTVARDVTERKRAEAKLHQASIYGRILIEASLDPLVTISREGKITGVNQATESVTGVSRERLIGTDFSDYFTRPEMAQKGYEQAFAEGRVTDYPLAIRHTSGRATQVLYNATVFKNETGQVEGVFAAARDITERKRVEEALNQSETRYRSLVTATAQVVWTTDARGEVIEDMPTWREFTGMTRQQIQGRSWIQSLHPDDRERTAAVWTQAVANRTLYDIEYRLWRHDGEYRRVAARGVPVLESNGNIREWVGTCTDITDRKRAEEEVRRLNEELEQRVVQRTAQLEAANKELEAFTYSVSHDLRAPLRHISGFSKILSEEFAPILPADAQGYLQRIDEGTRRMGQLVDDLLNLARIGRRELSVQVTGLRSIVDEVIAGLGPECAGREVEWKVGDLPFVECDPGLVKQVFQNLLSNAAKFTRPRSQAVIEVGQTLADDNPTVFVRDNGVGFNMKYADKLFGVFQRLHRQEDFEGTGVGLATIQRIIQKHGGRIWAEAQLDKGATFYFTLGTPEPSGVKTKAATVGDNV